MEPNDNILSLVEAWLRGQLGAEETAELERLMAEDTELADAVNSYKEAFEVLDETSWKLTEFNPDLQRARDYLSFYADEKNKAYFNELNAISQGGQRRSVINRRSIFGAVGVAAVILLSVVLLRNGGDTDVNALYAEYAALEEIPTFTVRGTTGEILSRIETQFHEENYAEVNAIISNHQDEFDEEQKSLIAIYQGVSFGERGMYEEAYAVLNDPAVFGNSIYGQMSEWYLALIMLNHEPDRARAKQLLKKIAGNSKHYKQAEAVQILGKL